MFSTSDPREDLILALGRDRRLAHATLFGHRHPDETPSFHYEAIDLWHSAHPRVLTEMFRGAGKSTLAEEAVVTMACLREVKNVVIGGENEPRAIERLASIKHEFETNDFIRELFGDLVGPTWAERKIILANGTIIHALGRGQSMRGTKYLDQRPDLFFGDDLEDEEAVSTPEARDKFMRWFMRVVMPALDPHARVRIAGTRLDPESLVVKLASFPNWRCTRIPWEHKDPETGERRATWPARFPLAKIDQTRVEFEQAGDMNGYQREYMCEAIDPASQIFTSDMFKVEPVVRTWQAVYGFVDPARTTKLKTSATTGWAVWSWVANRLIVWDGGGSLWKPDEIVNKLFTLDEEYEPVELGVEEDGLNEFIMQPIRHEQTRRGYMLPVRPMKAPREMNKESFIKGLQPFFRAGEVIFAKPLPELQAQFLSFPTGRIDGPNALAYALRMRPGAPVYDQFNTGNVAETLSVLPRAPLWLALNATPQYTTGVLCQLVDGAVQVLWDNVREGDPGAALVPLVQAASLHAGRSVTFVAGPRHFTDHDAIGIRGAARKVPIELRIGAPELDGRDELRALLKLQVKGMPALRVAHQARWTLNALSGGYAYEVQRSGQLSDFTREGPHRTLMEGLETFAGLLRSAAVDGENDRHYARTATGARYLTSLPTARTGLQETKFLKRG